VAFAHQFIVWWQG